MFDFHCHFFKNEKVEWFVLNTGLNKETNKKVLKSPYFKALGIHPLEINNGLGEDYVENELYFIEKTIDDGKINAIGEVGLDYHYNKDPKIISWQKELFYRFLDLAEDKDITVIIHSRDAEKELIEILETYDVRAVLHSFNYHKLELVKKAVESSHYFTISFNYSKKINDFIKIIPIENILIESDYPYKKQSRTVKDLSNYLPKTLEKIAEIKNLEKEEVEKIIDKTAFSLLKNIKK